MKNFLLLIWFIIAINIFPLKAQWSYMGLNNEIFNSFIAIENDYFAATSTGNGLYYTNNDNLNWVQRIAGIDICYPNSLIYFGTNIFLGTDRGVYYSTNLGIIWKQKESMINNSIKLKEFSKIVSYKTNIFAICRGTLYFSIDSCDTWEKIIIDNEENSQLSLAFGSNKIYAAARIDRYGELDDGSWGKIPYAKIYLSTDNGNNWIPKYEFKNTIIANMITNNNNIYLSTYYNIYRSNDDGKSWIEINPNLKDVFFGKLAVLGTNIFTCSQNGVFFSTNNGDKWLLTNSGLPNVAVQDLVISNGMIYALTDRRGIYRAKLTDFGITDTKDSKLENYDLQITPNPSTDKISITLNNELQYPINEDVYIYNSLGEIILIVPFKSNTVNLNISSLKVGMYFVKIGEITAKFLKN